MPSTGSPHDTEQTRRGDVARRRAEIADLELQSCLTRTPAWHAARLAKIAAIEQEIKDLEKKP
jgi:hypothetical protein